jgi:hypothetical protein
MELKEFVKDVLIQLNSAVDEARETSSRDIHFSEKDDKRTIEFDIAVSAEKKDSTAGKTGIRVLQFAEAGGDISKEYKNSTVSRIIFGLRIDPSTKVEHSEQIARMEAHNNNLPNHIY